MIPMTRPRNPAARPRKSAPIPEQRRVGRPSVGDAKLSRVRSLKQHPDEVREQVSIATRHGLSWSKWVRRLIMGAMEQERGQTTVVSPMTAAEKTIAIIILAEALQAATNVGEPAPRVARLRDWMRAPLQIGDLVVEMSTAHRGPRSSRVGVVLKISQHQSAYERVTEILMLDPPCGKMSCMDQECIHRQCWSDATFIRVPATTAQLAGALGRKALGNEPGVGRDALIAALADAGIKVKSRSPIVRLCLNCEQQVTLSYDECRGYHRAICSCGAHCTAGPGAA